jgi:hypothetical protein
VLAELVRAAGLVRRIGTNLNQAAVAKLNTSARPRSSRASIPCPGRDLEAVGLLDPRGLASRRIDSV